jgi:outer membrane protein assembly factor BamB
LKLNRIFQMIKIKMLIFLTISCIFATLEAKILSQWSGPFRNGIFPDEKLLKEWPQDGPKLLWEIGNLGEGYSSASVTNDRVYLTGMIHGDGFLFAYTLDGKLVWKTSYGSEWDSGHPGARTTPTVVDDKIYLMSGKGRVVCLDTNGKILWQVDLIKTFGARNLEWGMTESLLVDGDKLFCTPGGREVMMAVLDRYTGKTILKIKGNGEESSYCSPVLVTHGKRRLILTMTGKSLVGVDADTGEYLWKTTHITQYDINPNSPIYDQGKILTVSGYGTTGTQLFQLQADGLTIKKLWDNKRLDNQIGGIVLVDGYIYGSGHRFAGWKCLDWNTGQLQFEARTLGNRGNIIFSDGMLYLYSEGGDVAIVKPNPQKFDVVSSFRVTKGSGPHWAHLVIKNGRLYIRHGEMLMVYDIASK